VRSWTAAELALWASGEGDRDGVAALASHAIEPAAAAMLWRAEADALLTAGDSAAAREAFAALTANGADARRACSRSRPAPPAPAKERSMAKERLFLIDGSALAYRSFFALIRSPLTNSRGMNTSAASFTPSAIGMTDSVRTIS